MQADAASLVSDRIDSPSSVWTRVHPWLRFGLPEKPTRSLRSVSYPNTFCRIWNGGYEAKGWLEEAFELAEAAPARQNQQRRGNVASCRLFINPPAEVSLRLGELNIVNGRGQVACFRLDAGRLLSSGVFHPIQKTRTRRTKTPMPGRSAHAF